MIVLVSGTSGFIGKNLVNHLNEKSIFSIQLNRSPHPNSQTYDFLEDEHCSANIWIHLAAISKDSTNTRLSSQYHKVNVLLTKRMFSAFLGDPKATTFIFMSTVKAAAAKVDGWLSELDQFEVDKPYGSSKREAEQYLLNNTLPENKKLIVLRPSMVYGNNRDSNLYRLFSFVDKGIPYPFASFSNSKALLSINNLMFVIEKIINKPSFKGGIYNVSDSEEISTNEIIKLISEVLSKKSRMLYLPKKLIYFIAKVGTVLHLPINVNKMEKLTCNYLVSNKKLLAEIGCQLPFSTLKELKKTFESYKD